jgi:hypothetical protein
MGSKLALSHAKLRSFVSPETEAPNKHRDISWLHSYASWRLYLNLNILDS